jgi:hypothetical protein
MWRRAASFSRLRRDPRHKQAAEALSPCRCTSLGDRGDQINADGARLTRSRDERPRARSSRATQSPALIMERLDASGDLAARNLACVATSH